MRIGEALALRWGDVELTPGRESLRLRTTKGRADRNVPMMPGALLAELRRRHNAGVIDASRDPAENPDLPVVLAATVSSWGHARAWSYRAALAAWSQFVKRHGVKATPHQLRHTRATELARAGVSPFVIRQLLGWRKLEHAARYCEPGDVRAELRRAADSTTPRPNRRPRS